jgi:hypothetical protein
MENELFLKKNIAWKEETKFSSPNFSKRVNTWTPQVLSDLTSCPYKPS